MSLYVEKLEATGVYGLFDISQSFRPGVNVLFARNGKGKTTLLHIIANLLNEDYQRFAFIDFDSITMRTSDGNTVKLTKENEEDKKVIKIWKDRSAENTTVKAAYFPSFRTIVEVWASTEDKTGQSQVISTEEIEERKTKFARKLFGDFVPAIDYPSTLEIEKNLNEAFKQQQSFAAIEKFLKAVNSFLEDKKIEVLWENLSKPSSRRNALGIKFNDGLATIPGINRALSSGERQIITLIYAASQMSKNKIVLVDDPEIYLHVDWQRLLLKQMSRQLGQRQIIVCAHSPIIGADYEDEVIMFEPTITQNSNPRKSQEEMELVW